MAAGQEAVAAAGASSRVELTVEQLRELRTALESEDPTAVMTRLDLTPQSMPFAIDASLGMSPPLGLPPPDDSNRIWLRCGHGPGDEHWDISILDYAEEGYNGSLASVAVLKSWNLATPTSVHSQQ